MFVITTATSNTTDIVIMKVLLTPFCNVPYYVKRYATRRIVANIKHELFFNHGVRKAVDDNTSVQNVGDDDIDGFIVRSYWEGGKKL